jgi:hypothetical protein
MGVEHWVKATIPSPHLSLRLALMPMGVEHSLSRTIPVVRVIFD